MTEDNNSKSKLIPSGRGEITPSSSALAKRGLEIISPGKSRTFDQSNAIRTFNGIGDRGIVVFSADGGHAVIRNFGIYMGMGKRELQVTLWNTQTGLTENLNFKPKDPGDDSEPWDYLYTIAISHNKKYLMTGSGSHPAKLWDIQAGEEIDNIYSDTKVMGSVWDIQFLPDDKSVMIRSDNIFQIDLQSGKVVRKFNAGRGSVAAVDGRQLAISNNGKNLLVGSMGRLLLYDILSGKRLLAYTFPPRELRFTNPSGMIYSVDDEKFLFCYKGGLFMYDTFSSENQLLLQSEGEYVCCDFSSDNYAIAGSFAKNTMTIWDMTEGRQVAQYNHENQVVAVKYLPVNNQLLSACWDGSVYLWDASYLKK